MNAQESQLFNDLFLKCLKDFFLRDDQKSYHITDILHGMPVVYCLEGLINSGITYLVLDGTIAGTGIEPNRRFQVTPEGIQRRATENEEIRVNKEIDLEIKNRTLDQLGWERIPKKFWWLIAIVTALLGALVGKLFH